MKVTPEKLENNKAKLTIEVPAEQFEKSLDKAFSQAVKKLNIPGFRKGKAPRHVVENMYGRDLFMEDAIKDVIPDAFSEAVKQAGEEYACIVYPSYDVVSSEKGEGLVFTAEYDLKPEIKLGDYKGMKLEKPSEEPEEGAVDKQLKAMQERFARLDVVEGPAQLGDVCLIDFLGKLDQVPFEGGAGQDHSLELGSNSFIPGFEEQLVGAQAGDEVEVNVTFPEDYRATDLAGKAVVFEVVVKEVKRKVLSEMDDEFAKDVSEFDTLDELKADLENKLKTQAKDKAIADLERQVIEKALAEATMEVPESFINIRLDQLIEDFSRQIGQQGINFEQYMEITGATAESIRQQFQERAEKETKTELLLEAIGQKEALEISDEELTEEYENLSKQTNMTVENIREQYGTNEEWVASLKYSLKMNKAIKLMVNEAKY